MTAPADPAPAPAPAVPPRGPGPGPGPGAPRWLRVLLVVSLGSAAGLAVIGRGGRRWLTDCACKRNALRGSRRMRRVGCAERPSARGRAPLNGPGLGLACGARQAVPEPRAEQCSASTAHPFKAALSSDTRN